MIGEIRGLLPLDKPANLTFFGNVSMQVRRAAETLGYSSDLTRAQENAIIYSLEDPVQNIFIATKHLSGLRSIDFPGPPGAKMTAYQVEVVATRYNRGPDPSLQNIQNHMSYGRTITKRWDHFTNLLRPRN